MIGAYLNNHPWGVFDAPVVVEEPLFPGLAGLPRQFSLRDEIYVVTASPYSRDTLDVLASLDASRVNLNIPGLNRTDRDFPIAWVKNYGKGRVFYSTLGHSDESWDDPRVQTMYFEAIKWALGLTPYQVKPHALAPAANAK